MESLQKIDLHLHLSRIPLPRTEQMWVSDPAEMLPHMAELGIQKAVLMSTSENSQPQMPFGSNADNRAIAQADPSHFAWMCNLDPLDLDTIPERLAAYKAEGAVGIGELCINRRLDDPILEKIFAAAGELELPITFHMSPEVGYSYGIVDDPGLPLLERALQKFPKTKFLGHGLRCSRRTGAGAVRQVSESVRRPERQQRRTGHPAGSGIRTGISGNVC